MYSALEVGTGRRVHASAAQRYGRYLCPVCHAQVNLRKGDYRDAHFAHAPGQGTIACDEFHPSDSWYGQIDRPLMFPPPGDLPIHQRLSLQLYLQPAAGHSPISWGLEVLVPKAPSSDGTLTFDGGGDGFRVHVACSKLHNGAQRYPVNPDAQAYFVSWASADVDRNFAAAVQERISGPDPGLTTAFSAKKEGGRERAVGLNWGGSYYFIQRTNNSERIPPDIAVARLANLGGWSCSFVTLPSIADETLARWLIRATNLPIHPAKGLWGVALPATQVRDSSARLVLNSTKSLLLAVRPGDGGHGPVRLRATVDGDEAEAELQLGAWSFVGVSGFSPNHIPTIEIDGYNLPELQTQPFAWSPPEVLLQFGEQVVPGNSPQTGEYLSKVRAGEAELSGMIIPAALEFSLIYRKEDELGWTKLPLSTASNVNPWTRRLTVVWIEDATAIIRDTCLDVVLDLGPFGYWWCDAHPSKAVSPSISPATRRHAEWILGAAGRPTDAVRGSDDTLASEIKRLIPPRWLIAHHRLAKVRMRRKGDKA